MRKNFGPKTWMYPLPVLIIATYDESGKPNAMNAEEKETLQKAKDCWEELIRYAECDAFVIGFRLGAQILVAALSNI